MKLPFVITILFCLFLSGHFTQVLLYAAFCQNTIIARVKKMKIKINIISLYKNQARILADGRTDGWRINYRLHLMKQILGCNM